MVRFRFIGKENLKTLPKNPGIYCFKNGEILYIGKAANLRERIKNHFNQPSWRDQLFLEKVEKIGYFETNSEIEALILEAKLIKKFQPKFNVIWRDDKNYFFVGRTKEDYPRIFITHQKKENEGKTKAEYLGPFVEGKALKAVLKILREAFPFRSCRVLPKRPCLWYHLKKCPAPCFLKTKKVKKICQKNSKKVMEILEEGIGPILKELKKEMEKAAEREEFEKAAVLRDQILVLEKISQHKKIFEEKLKFNEWPEIEKKLKQILKIKKVKRIEAYDVSQIHGNLAVGAMVSFLKGMPEKNLYRRFKIKFTQVPSDVLMLREILERRFSHSEWGLPDVILIDGGVAQLNVAVSLKKEKKIPNLKVLALAKKEEKLFIEGKKEPIFAKKLPREIFNLFLQLRDEAHRFAITYHKKLREKNLFS